LIFIIDLVKKRVKSSKRGEPLVVKFVSYEAFKQIVIKKDPTFWHHESAYKMLLIALEEWEVSPK